MTDENRKDPPRCFLCNRKLDGPEEDFHCFGCDELICETCDTNLGLMGAHEPEDHRAEEAD